MITPSLRADDILSTLRKEHPRLLVLTDDFAKAKTVGTKDPRARVYYKQIQSDSAKFLLQPPLKRGKGQMLETSRQALGRITFLAALYRMDGDRRYADRARDEMMSIAQFNDWDPSHFLDTAEMTAAMGIGYDWLFEALSPDERATIKTAIIEKGLKPGLDAYGKGEWWTKVSHNWANVCAGGLALGALAIADEEPDLARNVLAQTRKAIDSPMSHFAPDGGWLEGPGYWDYATRYTVFYMAAAQTALGNDLGLSDYEGFDKTGLFRVYTNGPAGKAFNFADSSDFPGPASQMFWLAKRYNQPAYAISEREFAAKWGDAFHLLWFDGDGTTMADANLPLDAAFRRVDVASFRSAWHDSSAIYLGFKGGNNAANHAHLDMGTFVLDAFGQRWATDLGSDNYDLPEYFGKLRFTYYRTSTAGHNTLSIDDTNQDAQARGKLVAFSSTADRAFAVADLSPGYKWCNATVKRGVELLNRNTVVIVDEVDAKQPVNVQWNMHTPAFIAIADDKRSANLAIADKFLAARILSPADATFDSSGCDPGKPQNANKGIVKLMVKLPAKVTSTRIVVVLGAKENVGQINDAPPLDDWIKTGELKQ